MLGEASDVSNETDLEYLYSNLQALEYDTWKLEYLGLYESIHSLVP